MEKIPVIPCSGIGKVFGLMAREAALEITEELRPDCTETVCLAYLVTGDREAVSRVAGKPCITIDGCPAHCAAKSVEQAGGILAAKYKSVDVMRKHRGADPGTATSLTEAGWKITEEFAAEIGEKVDLIRGEAH